MSDLATDTEQTDREAKPAHRQKRLNAVSVFILLILMSYFALTVYSGTLFPLRLVKGTSMEPNLVSGDVVIIKKAAFSSLSVGDVIAYKTPDLARGKVGTPRAILHRIIDMKSTDSSRVLTTQGDNSDPDPWTVTESSYQGTLRFRLPYVGWPLVFITSPKGILFVSIGTLITILYFPAMIMFHMTVLRKPKETTTLAVKRDDLVTAYASSEGVSDAVNSPGIGDTDIQGVLTELNDSVSVYAANIRSQTDLVQNLAAVTHMLKGALDGEGNQVNAKAIMFGIMIVDDQEPFRKRARDVLEIEGDFQVLAEASDGKEALEKMEEISPDLVLMDVQMPEMNGFEAARKIQEKYPGTKIALISMDNDQEYVRMAKEVGASGFIAKKDLSPETIRKAIQERDQSET